MKPQDETLPAGAPARRHLAGSILSVGVGQVASVLAAALTSIAIARLLGPGGVGTYALSATVLFISMIAFELGLSFGTAYFVGRGEWAGRSLARGLVGACAVLGLVGSGMLLLGYLLLGDRLPGVTWTMAVGLAVALPWALLYRSGIQAALAQERFELFAGFVFSWLLLALPLSVTLAAISGIEAAVLGLAAAPVIAGTAVGVWLITQARDPTRSSSSPPGGVRSVANFGVRAWGAQLLQQLNYRGDLVLLGALTLAAADVGVYSVAVSVTSIAWVLSNSLAVSALPRSARMTAESERGTASGHQRDLSDARTVRHAVLLIPALALLVAALLLIGVPLVYGSGFDRSIGLGFLLLPGTLSLGPGSVALAILLGRGRSDRVLRVGLAVVPATIVAYLLVIPSLEATGAALVSSASYLTLTLLAVAVLQRSTQLGLRAMLVPGGEDIADYRAIFSKARTAVGRRLTTS